MTDIAIIGAGPYGLSLAAHLGRTSVQFRAFGQPMRTWRKHMPAGMSLKSEGFASNLSDPQGALTLERYCADNALPYAHIGLPVPLATFTAYGLAFQQRFVADVEAREVSALTHDGSSFMLRLDDDAAVPCRRVVIAVGITHFASIPDELAGLPPALLSHSAAHHDLTKFSGQSIAVIGSGASAVDIAVLAHQAGAEVHLVSRRRAIEFHDAPSDGGRSVYERMRRPQTGLGPSWTSWFSTELPLAFHALPEGTRQRVLRTHLGPAACWFTRGAFTGNVIFHGGVRIAGAARTGNQATLTLDAGEGKRQELRIDHIIAATGYRPDIGRLPFLDPGLIQAVNTRNGSPVLSRNFESSVPGLYFMGLTAAASFGPMLRFAYGSDYAARRLARHLIGTRSASAR
jgi:cation diffusion facilitator CzcD-associated flavoprotein CzcO